MTIRDREHRFIYANPAALAHLGFASVEDLRDTAPDDHERISSCADEDGREFAMDDIPSVRLLRGEAAEPLLIRTVHRQTGVQRWNLLKAAPLIDEAGQVQATIMIIEDVTEQQRAELTRRFLAQASEVLASSLDYEQTLRNVAAAGRPRDRRLVRGRPGRRRGRPHAGRRRSRRSDARCSWPRSCAPTNPRELDPHQGLGRVLRTGESVLYPRDPGRASGQRRDR